MKLKPLQVPVAEERIEWLLKFLRSDLTTLRPGELLDLRNDVFAYLHEGDLATVTVFDADELRALGPVPPRRTDVGVQQVITAARDIMIDLQGELRAGVAALERAGTWQPFALDRPAPHWSIERRADGTIRRCYTGAWRTITLSSATDLLVQWWPQLRRCKYARCNVLFRPEEGRQLYHDPKCSSLARWYRLPKRKRDYKQELANANRRAKVKTTRHIKNGKRKS